MTPTGEVVQPPPVSGYNVYCAEARASVIASGIHLEKEIMAECAKRWKALTA